MSRLDPFDFAFGALGAERFPEVRREAATRPEGAHDRARFAALPTVQRILATVEAPELIERHPEAAEQYVTALYVAYRFWQAGRVTVGFGPDALDAALAAGDRAALPAVPGGAVYVRLPQRWFWARIAPEAPAEPLDGFYVVASAEGREVTVLAVLGLRADRAGFSQIAVTATPEEVVGAGRAARRPPFASVLEGGARAGVRSLVTADELLHLAQLALHAVEH